MSRFTVALRRSGPALLLLSIFACLAEPSLAGSVMFDPTGSGSAGSALTVGTFDELPGNALAMGAETAIDTALASLAGKPTGTTATTSAFTLYYQANLSLLGPNGNVISTANEFTAVAKFSETATVTAGSNTVTFNLAANQSGSYLDFFSHSGVPAGMTAGNNLTGVGFASDDPKATLIYAASVPSGAPSGNFTNNGGSTSIDPNNNNPQQSVTGFGATKLSAGTTYFNSNYFLGNPGPFLAFSSTNTLIFDTVGATSSFVNLTQSGSTISNLGYIAPSLGNVNGQPLGGGHDVQFQADASSSFAVPEPASFAMTLLGFGGAGLGTFMARRKKVASVA